MPLPRRAPDARASLSSLPLFARVVARHEVQHALGRRVALLGLVALALRAVGRLVEHQGVAHRRARARGTGAGLAPPLAGAGLAPRGPASSSSRPSPPPPSLSSWFW